MEANGVATQKGAPYSKFKTVLRRETRRRATEPEINFLNITAMMDMMTIILVFLLKSLSASSANLPQTSDLALPTSILSGEPAQDGIQIIVSKDKILVNGRDVKGIEVPGCFTNPKDAPKATDMYRLAFCTGDSPRGFAPKFKARGTASDLELSPLLSALEDPVRVAEEQSKHKPQNQGKPFVEAMVLFDRYTSYRVMTEIMFTLSQAKVAKFHFVAMSSGK